MRKLIVFIGTLLAIGNGAPALGIENDAINDVHAGAMASHRGNDAEGIRLLTRAIDSGRLPQEFLYGNRGTAYAKLASTSTRSRT